MKKAFPAFLTVFLMSLCMIFCAANVSAAEVIANAECGDYTAWAVYDNGTMEIVGRGEVDEFPIYMFMDEDVRLSVTSLVVGEGVTRVAGLNDFTYLTSVSLPSTLTVVGESAFEGCVSLESITLPEGVISLHDAAFKGCTSLEQIEIPSTVSTIYGTAFNNCPGTITIYGQAGSYAETMADRDSPPMAEAIHTKISFKNSILFSPLI